MISLSLLVILVRRKAFASWILFQFLSIVFSIFFYNIQFSCIHILNNKNMFIDIFGKLHLETRMSKGQSTVSFPCFWRDCRFYLRHFCSTCRTILIQSALCFPDPKEAFTYSQHVCKYYIKFFTELWSQPVCSVKDNN